MARAKMLLVEDDAALAELLIWHFKREDFDVAHTVAGGWGAGASPIAMSGADSSQQHDSSGSSPQ